MGTWERTAHQWAVAAINRALLQKRRIWHGAWRSQPIVAYVRIVGADGYLGTDRPSMGGGRDKSGPTPKTTDMARRMAFSTDRGIRAYRRGRWVPGNGPPINGRWPR